jgi:hypothetical protein
MSAQSCKPIDEQMLQRIRGEFLEMPGLQLTCQQARRLWALDERGCRELLDRLVEEKFLWRNAQGEYSRVTDGATERPRLRAARAHLDRTDARPPKEATS